MAPFKVYVKRGDYEIKFGVPKSWRSGPVHKLLETFLSAFNNKFADAPLDAAAVHLRTREGVELASEEVLEAYVAHGTHLVVEDGPAPAATVNPKASGSGGGSGGAAGAAPKQPTESELMRAKGWLKCKNYGCQQWYDPATNEEGEPACKHHVSPPVFHDTKKGWTCCRDRLVYDWADFKLIEGCTKGRHSQEDPGAKFQQSPTLAAAEAAEAKAASKLKSVEDYVAANPNAATGAASMKQTVEAARKRVIREADGFYKCRNLGCGQYYDPATNSEIACTFHPEKPVFHDTIKYYGCCPKTQAYDWDGFMAIAGCTKGKHD